MYKIACNSQAQAAKARQQQQQLPLSLTQVGIVAAATAAAVAVAAPFRSLQQLSLPLIANIANFYLNIAVASADVVAINQLLVKHLPRPLTTLQPLSPTLFCFLLCAACVCSSVFKLRLSLI